MFPNNPSRLLLLFAISLCVLTVYCEDACRGDGFNCTCEYGTDAIAAIPTVAVDCTAKDLEEIPPVNRLPIHMGFLDLSLNNIKTLGENLLANRTVLHLNASYNKLSTVYDNTFSSLGETLLTLDLSHNNIQTLSVNVFKTLTKLTVLDLSFNNLLVLPANFFEPLVDLRHVSWSYNNDLGEYLGQAGNVHSLKLSVNLTRLDSDGVGLRHEVNFAFLRNLQNLSLADNPIKAFPNDIPVSLKYIDLSNTNLTSLRSINVSGNSLEVVKFNRLENLTKIDEFELDQFHCLKELWIENCPNLEDISELAFGNVSLKTNLTSVHFANNKLKELHMMYADLKDIVKEIDLQGNPWNCHCNLTWYSFLETILKNPDNVKCYTPEHFRDKPISAIKSDKICEEMQEMSSDGLQPFIIALLIVLVVILFVLITILIFMGPYDTSKQYPKVAPDSPYQRITLDSPSQEATELL